MMKLSKHIYPFRAGCTSYVIPDDIIPNVEYMGRLVDDIELVLFESPDISNLPSCGDIERLAELAADNRLTYSVHFPTTHKACGSDSAAFRADLQKIVQLTAPLDPFAWILHLEGLPLTPTKCSIKEWTAQAANALSLLTDCIDDMSRVAVENLAYPWQIHEDIVQEFNASLCLDVGHLWISEPQAWKTHAEAMLPFSRVVHLHGLHEGQDHLSLKKSNRDNLLSFISMLRKSRYRNIVTLEVFSEQDTMESLNVLAETWAHQP